MLNASSIRCLGAFLLGTSRTGSFSFKPVTTSIYRMQNQLMFSTISHKLDNVRKGTEEELTIAENAVERLKQIGASDEPAILRVYVEGGGCSGFQYKFEIEEGELDEEDVIFERDGCTVVTDEASLEFLRGSTIEFSKQLIRQTFRVNNPQAEYGCGCGTSFSVDLEKMKKKK
eukprot:Nk52_evm36s207 gene=Nk52_evmTU36s207